MNQFIKRDNVWEYLYGILKKMIGEAENVLIIGAGLEQGVIQRIGEQVKTEFDKKAQVDFLYYPFATPGSVLMQDWSLIYEIVIVVTDIINSGKTVELWVNTLQQTNSQSRPIGLFTVASMLNSPTKICGVEVTSSLIIKREYYEADAQKCILCQIEQPVTNVEIWEKFHRIENGQLTPYDFWEIIHDSKALLQSAPDNQGRVLSYRIDTTKVVERYKHWLINIIKHKFNENWPEMKIDAICVVDEQSGIKFASLVSESLEIEKIVKIDREILKRVTPVGGLPSGENPRFSLGDSILVVDDGINYGRTLRQLISYCRAAGHTPTGAMVFDNRLSEYQIKQIRSQMSNGHIVALYSWPARSEKL